jgi:hypothetical protein
MSNSLRITSLSRLAAAVACGLAACAAQAQSPAATTNVANADRCAVLRTQLSASLKGIEEGRTKLARLNAIQRAYISQRALLPPSSGVVMMLDTVDDRAALQEYHLNELSHRAEMVGAELKTCGGTA